MLSRSRRSDQAFKVLREGRIGVVMGSCNWQEFYLDEFPRPPKWIKTKVDTQTCDALYVLLSRKGEGLERICDR